MAVVALPIHEALRDLVVDLLGRGAAVDKRTAPIGGEDVGAIACYRVDAGVLAAVGLFDRDLVLILGGALTLMPRAALDEFRFRRELPDNVLENFWEVANILTSIINRSGKPHVSLAERHLSFDDITPDVRNAIDSPARSRAFDVTVEGYGTGGVGFFAV
jgi:hypothetical protein